MCVFRLSVKCWPLTVHQHPRSMTPISLRCLPQCYIADKHFVMLFQGFFLCGFFLLFIFVAGAEVQARHWHMRLQVRARSFTALMQPTVCVSVPAASNDQTLVPSATGLRVRKRTHRSTHGCSSSAKTPSPSVSSAACTPHQKWRLTCG